MFPKVGKKLPFGSCRLDGNDDFRLALAAALKGELGTTHQAIKTVMRWTDASERTVKHWFSGTHGPNGDHLVALARHSDAVLVCFLLAANRSHISVGVQWNRIRAMLLELVETIDSHDLSP